MAIMIVMKWWWWEGDNGEVVVIMIGGWGSWVGDAYRGEVAVVGMEIVMKWCSW